MSLAEGRDGLDLTEGWLRRWSVAWRLGGDAVSYPLDELAQSSLSGLGPVRWFTWRRDQRHRPGLVYMVSTGRLHGSESLEEARLLLALDFAAGVIEVVSQPLRLTFFGQAGRRVHTPDFLVRTRSGVWLIDVRPARLIEGKDRESFAAAAEVARVCGWRFAVAADWRQHVTVTLDCFSSRRRPVSDPLRVEPGLLAEAAEGRTFGELVDSSAFPPVARAHLLHLLWHRRLGLDLLEPLSDRSRVVPGETES
ncbi:TnsA-like heteromeric transposase endonuclease subunit [Kitasatospora mediocidica]|uniref:TnsA-like heteromeric transposase endonuclease subunit n=1 Tax=Kitasatospora mediocidica TaxID=58352 RepID=UPI001E37E30F|nr:TnsA-like heteromeric transposase endonuclease subunit [Kitasatospora mediocidica]